MSGKYLRIPVTNEQYQNVGIDGIALIEQRSTTSVRISYSNSNLVIDLTHADAGAGSEVPRDEIEKKVEELRQLNKVYIQLDALTYAVSAIATSHIDVNLDKSVYEEIDADRTLTAADTNKIFGIGTDALTVTLPAASVELIGTEYTFVNIGADGNNIITISPAAADAIKGSIANSAADSVASGVDDKDIINTKATANNGDRIKLTLLDITGWYITGGVGIWAPEA